MCWRDAHWPFNLVCHMPCCLFQSTEVSDQVEHLEHGLFNTDWPVGKIGREGHPTNVVQTPQGR